MQLSEFFGVLFGEIIGLREVLVDFVEFPWCFIGIPVAAIRLPRDEGGTRGHPSVVIETAVAEEFEVLGLAKAGSFGVVKGEGEADSFHRLLLHAVQFSRSSDSAELVEGRDDVDDVEELRAQAAFVLDAGGPGDDHGVARAAEVAGDLLGPLEGRVHGVRPGGWEVVEVLGAAEFVDSFDVVLPFFRESVEEQVFAERAFEAAFGAGAVVARRCRR